MKNLIFETRNTEIIEDYLFYIPKCGVNLGEICPDLPIFRCIKLETIEDYPFYVSKCGVNFLDLPYISMYKIK